MYRFEFHGIEDSIHEDVAVESTGNGDERWTDIVDLFHGFLVARGYSLTRENILNEMAEIAG